MFLTRQRRRSLVLGLPSVALAHAAVLTVSPAEAEEAIALTPPAPLGSTEVPYPRDGQGEARVLVDVLIERDGTVSEARVVEGSAPFAEAARMAALGWWFLPARRGDTPVVSRIRARVDFHPPLAPPKTATPDAAAAPAPLAPTPPSAIAEPTLEVTVQGVRRELGQTTLSAAEVREMPGAFGDAFRAIEALPGVAPIVSGIPYFYIRGAPPNDTGYLVDEVRVPFLFHVGIGEGVIHPALMERVDVYAGAPPAAFGGQAGAIISGQTRQPSAQPHGEANLRLFDAGALVETPLAEGRGSVLVAGRYGYPGPILGLVTPSVKLRYWDYQARATWRATERDTLAVFAFGSHDYLGTVPSRPAAASQGEVEQLGSDFHRLDLRYDRARDDGHLRAALTLGYDQQGGAIGADDAPPATIRDWSVAFRLATEEAMDASWRLRAGVDVKLDRYGFAQSPGFETGTGEQPAVPSSADPPPTNVMSGAHVDVVWRPSARLEIVPGARVDVFQSTRPSAPAGAARRTTVPAFDPRLSVRWGLTPTLALLTGLGISHQFPALRVGPLPGVLLSVPGFPFGGSQVQRTVQLSEGVEVALPADVLFTANGFLSLWSGLTDLTATCRQIMPPTMPPADPNASPPPVPYTCPSADPVAGRAYGLEVLVRRSLSRRLTGWLSYTLSHARRQAHFITLEGGDATDTVTADFDRTHVLNAMAAYVLGAGWRAGARFVYYTGAPYSTLAGNFPVPPYNAYRAPAFFRLDVRLEKRWSLGKDRSVSFVLEGLNVTLSREVSPLALDCRGDMTALGGTTQCTQGRFGPLTIPSAGVEVVF